MEVFKEFLGLFSAPDCLPVDVGNVVKVVIEQRVDCRVIRLYIVGYPVKRIGDKMNGLRFLVFCSER